MYNLWNDFKDTALLLSKEELSVHFIFLPYHVECIEQLRELQNRPFGLCSITAHVIFIRRESVLTRRATLNAGPLRDGDIVQGITNYSGE